MRSDDIAPLLVPPPPPEIGLRQGKLLAWNPSTGANTVELAGQSFTDLPILASGTLAMAVGDVIALLRYATTYFILGAIRNAGLGTMSVRADRVVFPFGTGGDTVTSGSFVSPATFGPQVVDVYIGASRRCLVTISAQIGVGDCTGYVSYSVNGASTINAEEFRGAMLSSANITGGGSIAGTVSKTSLLTAADGLNEGLHTFTTRVRRDDESAGSAYIVSDRDLVIQPFA